MPGGQGAWVMAFSIVSLCLMILALVYLPGFQPGEDVLDCDRQGGSWSSAEAACRLSDNPAAGLAA